jgi:hypothetical protein
MRESKKSHPRDQKTFPAWENGKKTSLGGGKNISILTGAFSILSITLFRWKAETKKVATLVVY